MSLREDFDRGLRGAAGLWQQCLDVDRLEMALVLTVGGLLVHGGSSWYVMAPLAVLCMAGFALRPLLFNSTYWLVLPEFVLVRLPCVECLLALGFEVDGLIRQLPRHRDVTSGLAGPVSTREIISAGDGAGEEGKRDDSEKRFLHGERAGAVPYWPGAFLLSGL